MFFENLLLALKTMKSNRMRTILSLLGVMIGVASLVTILSLGASVQKTMTDSYADSGVDVITITPARSRNSNAIFTESFADDLKNTITGVDSVLAINSGNFTIRYSNENTSASVVGVASTFDSFYSLKFQAGGWFTREDNIQSRQVCILGSDIAETLFQTQSPIGKYIKLYRNSAKSFLCIGVLESRDPTMSVAFDNSVFVPYNTFTQRLTNTGRVGTYVLHVAENFDPVKVADNASAYMDSLVSSEGYNMFSAATLAEILSSTLGTYALFLAAAAAISLLVGGIGIMNIMLVSVAERTREIGIRKALGASASVIQHQFLVEAIIMTLSGGFLGIIAGTLISFIASVIIKWSFMVSLPSYAIGVIFSIVVGIFFGWYPSRKAARLNPIDALTHD